MPATFKWFLHEVGEELISAVYVIQLRFRQLDISICYQLTHTNTNQHILFAKAYWPPSELHCTELNKGPLKKFSIIQHFSTKTSSDNKYISIYNSWVRKE